MTARQLASLEAFERRYAFVDWSSTRLHLDAFDMQALDLF